MTEGINMGKNSSDSDTNSDKRNSKKLRARRSDDRSFSSDSSSSKTRRRKYRKRRRHRSKSKGNDKYSRFRSSSRHKTTSYHSFSKSSHHSVSPDTSRKKSSSKDHYRLKNKRSKSRKSAQRSSQSDLRGRRRTKKSESRDSSVHGEKSDNSSSSSSLHEQKTNSKDINLDKEILIVENTRSNHNNLNQENAKINSDILREINDDGFTLKQFISVKNSKIVPYNIVIDLKSQTIKIPDVEITEPDSVFHPNLFVNEETRAEKWVKELYVYRQKILNDENNV